MKKLVIYPGRFQPFHKGHAQVFNWLKNKFGDAIIATSDKVEAPKSPFNFNEKKQMMKLAGVPASKVKQVLNPYLAREILKDYDPKTTVLIFAVSQKDMEEDPRFTFLTKKGKPGYLQRYDEHENNLKPFGDVQKMKGYVIVTPTFTFNVLGKPATSASELRKQFVSLDSKKQKEFITAKNLKADKRRSYSQATSTYARFICIICI
jgi:cytidyltransferase-like protein